MTTEFYLMLVTALVAVVGLWAQMWKVSSLRMKVEEQRSEISRLKRSLDCETARYIDLHNAYIYIRAPEISGR